MEEPAPRTPTEQPTRPSPSSKPKAPSPKAPSPKPSSSESSLEAINRRATEMAAKAEVSALISSGEKATLEGTITSTTTSQSGKSHYLQFKTSQGEQLIWAMFRTADWEDFDTSTLDGLIGKNARFTGRWTPESSSRKTVLRMSATRQFEILD